MGSGKMMTGKRKSARRRQGAVLAFLLAGAAAAPATAQEWPYKEAEVGLAALAMRDCKLTDVPKPNEVGNRNASCADAAMKVKQYDLALTYAKRAVTYYEDPANAGDIAKTYLNFRNLSSFALAESLYRLGRLEDAHVAFARLLNDQATYVTKGDGYVDFEVAFRRFKELTDTLDVNYKAAEKAANPAAYTAFTEGNGAYIAQNYAAAKAAYQRAVQLRPTNGLYLHCLATAKGSLGETEGAIADFRKARSLLSKPYYGYRSAMLADALSAAGRYDEAIPLFEEAVRQRPDLAYIRDNLDNTRTLKQQRDHPAAFAAYNRGLTAVLANKGGGRAAVADLSEAIRLDPDFTLAYSMRALAATLDGSGSDADAAQALSDAEYGFTHNLTSLSALFALGKTHWFWAWRGENMPAYSVKYMAAGKLRAPNQVGFGQIWQAAKETVARGSPQVQAYQAAQARAAQEQSEPSIYDKVFVVRPAGTYAPPPPPSPEEYCSRPSNWSSTYSSCLEAAERDRKARARRNGYLGN